MRKRNAIAIAILLSGAAYALAVALADRVFLDPRVPPGREQRAALAIRDHVIPFQQWGTSLFTTRYLSRYYDRSWYFTQARRGDCEAQFTACLDAALTRYPQVDLFLLAHTNQYIEWVAKLPAERRQRLRLVYNTGCYNLAQGADWRDLGAKTYVGHPGVSESSVFYVFFLRRWTRGWTVRDALEASNRLMARTFRHAEFFSGGRLNAALLMRESTASLVGDADLRVGEGAQ